MDNEHKAGLALGAMIGLGFVALAGVGFLAYSIYQESIFARIAWDIPWARMWFATGLVIGAAWALLNWLNKGK